MTTIAYRDGVMACDSCWTYGGTVDVLSTKITRLSSGALLGQSGQNDARSVVALLDRVKTPAQMPTYEALLERRVLFLGLLVLPKGRMFKVATTHVPTTMWDDEFDSDDVGIWELSGQFAAVGSGDSLALGAMAAGKSARDAVAIACRFDQIGRAHV